MCDLHTVRVWIPVHLFLRTWCLFIMGPSDNEFSISGLVRIMTVKVSDDHAPTGRLTDRPRAYLGRELVRRRPAGSATSATSHAAQNISDAESPNETEKEWFEGSTPGLGEARRGPCVITTAAPHDASLSSHDLYARVRHSGSRHGLEIS